MELMSSLLLCALAALLPQGLSDNTFVYEMQLRQHNTSYFPHKTLFLNNGKSMVDKGKDLQNVFNVYTCRKCISCMERALNAENNKLASKRLRPIDIKDLENDVLANNAYENHRNKRDVNKTVTKKSKNGRSKRNRVLKTVTVTKYNVGGEVYALKVKEANQEASNEGKTALSTCQVYNVKKSFPCDTPEADLLLTVSRSKFNKKGKKKQKENTTNATTDNAKKTTAIFRKREATQDNSQAQGQVQAIDTYMPSIEDLY